MQNDVVTKTHSSITITNKQFWGQNENSLLHAFNSRWLNQWWKAFLSSAVEAATFHCLWRRNFKVHPVYKFCYGFLLSMKLPQLSARCPVDGTFFFSFIPFNGMILRESSSLSSPFLFVTSAKDSILRTLSSSCGAICFKIFPRWRD